MKNNFVSEEVEKLAMKCKLFGTQRLDTKELFGQQLTFTSEQMYDLDTKFYRGNCYKEDIKKNSKNIKKMLKCDTTNRQAFVEWNSSMGKKYPSCISAIHAIYDTKMHRMRYNVYIRSSDAYKKLLSDIKFLNFLITSHLTDTNEEFVLEITFGTVHVYNKDIEKRRHTDPKTIFFDGLDKTGKTSIQRLLFKMRDKIDFIGDRFMISPIAFNEIYARPWVQTAEADDHYIKTMLNISEFATYFYFRADARIIHQRCIEHKEMQLQDYENVVNQLKTFDSVVRIMEANKIEINTIDTSETTAFDAAWECYKALQ